MSLGISNLLRLPNGRVDRGEDAAAVVGRDEVELADNLGNHEVEAHGKTGGDQQTL